MSLSSQERQALRSIEEDLSGSDPKLVSLMATFTRLTQDEELPRHEQIAASGRPRGPRRPRAGRYRRPATRGARAWPASRRPCIGLACAQDIIAETGTDRAVFPTPAPVRFLSTFDALILLGHAKRARLVPEEHREKVFSTKMPQSIPTFFVDGRMAGTWRHVDGRVVPTPFDPLPRAAQRAVDAEAERLTVFHRDG